MKPAFKLVAPLLGTVLMAATLVFAAGRGTPPTSPPPSPSTVEAYGQLPLSFEENVGQAAPGVRFLARTGAGNLLLGSDDATLVLSDGALRMRLQGANQAPRIEAGQRQSGQVNYLRGSDPAGWRIGVPTYDDVRYQEVYDGVDLLWHGTRGGLEYDFVVRPGADPGAIALAPEGASSSRIDSSGDLVITVGASEVRHRRPQVYQDIDGGRWPVDGAFRIGPDGRMGFVLGAYDTTVPVVIDPVVYSTYLGGSRGDEAQDVAADTGGNAYVVGATQSADLPIVPGAFQPAHSPGQSQDVFVSKLNPNGSALVYSTYLGPGNPSAIEVDSAGNAFVGGQTTSPTFPTTPGAYRTAVAGDRDGFVVKLNSSGNALVYGSYFGGLVAGMAIDSGGNAYVAGEAGPDFSATPGAFRTSPSPGPYQDTSVAKLNPTGSGVVYATYLGGALPDELRDIAVDGAGSAYVTGVTLSVDFPTTPGVLQPVKPTEEWHQTAIVTKFNTTGSALAYSTFLGGSGDTSSSSGNAITVDASGNAFIAGYVPSGTADFPTTSSAFQPTKPNPGRGTGFVTKLNPLGASLVYSTYLAGTTGDETPRSIATDSSGSALVAGTAYSADFPVQDPVQVSHGGDQDAFVTTFSPSGSSLLFSTLLGGARSDSATGAVMDTAANIYVAGVARSLNFPVQNALQPQKNGDEPGADYDAFVTKIGTGAAPPPRQKVADFDGNGTTDIAVFRPSNGTWFVRNGITTTWGTSGDIAVPGDYDGNGTTDIAVFRPSNGTWFVRNGVSATWGTSGDIPVPGDYDGNGTTDIAVFRPSNGTWFVRNGFSALWGTSGDIPVPGDYDGNGTTDIAVYRPSTSTWFVRNGVTALWGTSGDIPVPGDYDGNGTTDIAIYRPSTGTWYVRIGISVGWGTSGDIPVPGDYDGNGTSDIAVFRPSAGTWYVRNGISVGWGVGTDVPLPLPNAIYDPFF